MNKRLTLNALAAERLPIPEQGSIASNRSDAIRAIKNFNLPCVLKPINGGSSIGIHIIRDDASLQSIEVDEPCFIEQFISGKEITVGILGGKVLPIIEIRPKTKFYDFAAKYTDDTTLFLFDTLEPERAKTVSENALSAFNAIGASDFARVDFIVTEEKAYILEINTIPGFTSHSLLPMAAKKAGISFPELCDTIVTLASQRQKTENQKKDKHLKRQCQ